MDPETRRILLNKACNEYRRGKECVQRKPEAKMLRVGGVLMHKACAEVHMELTKET